MKLRITAVLLFLTILVVSCNLPGNIFNQPTEQGTPNATLTALFNVVFGTNTPNPLLTPEPPVAGGTATPGAVYPTVTFTSTRPPALFTAIPPTPTALQRESEPMSAAFLTKAPVQDGNYAEWVDLTTKYKIPYKVYGSSNWTGYSDLEGAFAAAWDNTNLYIAFKVTDELYTQKKTDAEMYLGDEVEVLIDTNLMGDFSLAFMDADDFQIGLSAGNAASGIQPSAYLWYPNGMKGKLPQVTMSTQFEENPIYRIEAAIPWSLLGITPYDGMRLGFAVNVNDNDNVTEYKYQTMISTASGFSVVDPTTWGELVLEK